MGNNVQISKSLFNALYRYHVCNDTGDAVYIKDELEEKMNRHIGRIMYGLAVSELCIQNAKEGY